MNITGPLADAVVELVTGQGPLDFSDVSSPIVGDTKATVEIVGHDWRADEDWTLFEWACRTVARWDGTVDPNVVRAALTGEHGLDIEPRRYSAFWQRAAGKHGFLDFDGWITNTDHKGGNAGKPLRRYRWRSAA